MFGWKRERAKCYYYTNFFEGWVGRHGRVSLGRLSWWLVARVDMSLSRRARAVEAGIYVLMEGKLVGRLLELYIYNI